MILFALKPLMNRILALIFCLCLSQLHARAQAKVENVILVTFDGYRWREVFDGAQKMELNCAKYTHGQCEKLTTQFWDNDPKVRREKLMPFFWNTIAKNGQLYGNRLLGSRVGVTNIYQFSYPGYNEIFTGQPSIKINSNDYGMDPNSNIFDSLSAHGFKGKMAGFATWDAFTRIINDQRTGVPVFAGLKPDAKGLVNAKGFSIDHWQTTVPRHNDGGQLDSFTYHVAKEYLQRNHPRFAFIGFDETDEDAHEGHYENYLNAANTLDRYMQDLWNFIQNDPQYKDKTAIIITCDHGRGDKILAFWQIHHTFIPHSKFTWIAVMGPGIKPKRRDKRRAAH